MRPRSIESPSAGQAAGSGPDLLRSVGRTLRTPGERCQTTNTAAGRSRGSPATRRSSAAMPPAEAPTTTISFVAIAGAMQAPRLPPPLGLQLFHEQDHALAALRGRDERRAGDAALDRLAAP